MQIDPCEDHPGWCEVNQDRLQVGDRLICIGGLTYEDYQKDRRSVPFDGYGPSQNVPITLLRNGLEHMILWQMPTISAAYRALSLSGLLFYLPFWLAGTVVLLFLRPRDQRWWLLVSCNYLVALWLATGMASQSHVVASSLVLHALTWLFAVAILHLHLLVPTSLLGRRSRHLLPFLYAVATTLALLELLQFLRHSAYFLGLLLAIPGSLGLLVFRLFKESSPAAQLATRLMLAGIGLALGPGLVLWLIPELLGLPAPGVLATGVALLAIPVLPLSYTYVIYKRNLGPLEFRANRLLSLYTFVLLYGTLFVLIFFIGSLWLSLPGYSVVFSLVVSIVFVGAALALRVRFQRLVDRLVYGTAYNPDDIIRAFTNQIPTVLNLTALAQLLSEKVAPSLLIRQSALYLLASEDVKLVYASGVSLSGTPKTLQQIQQLLVGTGQYQPVPSEAQDTYPDGHRFDWVRLVIPLEIRKKTVGVWLFGRRDPDDYYSQDDIMLLTTLARQVSVAIENAQLYEEAQREIAERKGIEKALRKSERQASAAIEAARALTFSYDIATGKIDWGGAIEEITGYTREEFAKVDIQEWTDRIHPDDREEILSILQEAMGKDRATAEYRFRTKKGYVTLSSISLTVKQNGKTVRLVGILQDITKCKQVEQALMASLKEKEVLLREIHHRVKNNMQLVSSLINLQTDYMQNEADIQILKGFQDRIRSMRLIHEKFYQSSDLTHIDFDAYVQDLLEALFRAYAVDKAKIAFQVNVKDSSLGIDTAIPLGLIINELVSNSLKHAFPEGKEGEIEIALHPRGKGKLELVVSDNGVGIPKDLDFRDTESLGLRLVTILVEDQLHGNIELDRTEGTKFIIRVKVK